MKKLIFALAILLSACQAVTATATPFPEDYATYITATPLPKPAVMPVSMSIRAIDKSFPLADYPYDWNADSHVDKAFVRQNGEAWEVVSHCDQYPGKFFKNIEVGDALNMNFSDGTTHIYFVDEAITVKYNRPAEPFRGTWSVGEQKFTPESFTAFIMRPNALVLHASICNPGFWYTPGQYIFIAYEH